MYTQTRVQMWTNTWLFLFVRKMSSKYSVHWANEQTHVKNKERKKESNEKNAYSKRTILFNGCERYGSFFCQCHEIPGFCVTEFITRMNFAVHLFGKFFYLLSIRKHSIWLSFSRFPFEIGYCSNVFRSLPFNFWHFTFCAFEYLMEHFPKQKRKKLK